MSTFGGFLRLAGKPVSSRGALAAVGAIVLISLAATGWTAWHRGIWYDEIWSLYFSHHDRGFWSALTTRWLKDNHPPAFYALAWLVAPLVGDDLFLRRTLNVLPLVAALAAIWRLARDDRRVRDFAVVLVLLVLGTTHAFDVMLEHRGYATQLAANMLLVTGLFAIFVRDGDRVPGERPITLAIGASLLVGFNLHYFSAFITGATIAVFIAALWLTGRRRWAVTLLLLAVLAGIPLVVVFLIERQLLGETAQSFWATTDFATGLRQIKRVIGSAYPLNILVALSAIAGLSLRRHRAGTSHAFAITAAVAIVLTSALLLAANTQRPFISPRYLTALVPVCAALLASLSAGTILRYRWLTMLAVVLSIAGIVRAYHKQADVRQWDATAAVVSAIVRACPEAIVQVRPRWIIPGDIPPQVVMANEPAVLDFGYAHVAAAWHFTVERSARVSARCDTILWIEQHASVSPADAAKWAGLPVSPGQIARARLIRGETGFVIAYPAARQ